MKQYLLGSLLLVPGLALAQTPTAAAQTPFTLKGTIGKLNAPAKVYLLRDGRFRDSTALINGAFELKGTMEKPQETRLLLQRQGKLKYGLRSGQYEELTFFLEPGPVLISSPDSLGRARVTGNVATREYQQLVAALGPVNSRENALLAESDRTPEAERPAFDERTKELFAACQQQRQQVQAVFIKAHPDSWVSFFALQELSIGNPAYDLVAPLYQGLGPAIKASAAGRAYAERLARMQAVRIGGQAPDFGLPTPEGRNVTLADYRGKYVLVDFWASWCHPCRAENPHVLRAYNEFKGRSFEVLGISLDDQRGREKWLKAIKEDGMPWTQVSDLLGMNRSEVARRYDVQSIPQNFLVDPSGHIVAINLRGDELRATLARFIK